MDDRDKKIIDMLQEDGRRPFTDIAKELGLSEATVRKRVKNMEEEGVINGYTVKVNPRSMGYSTRTLLGLDTEPGNLLHIAEELSKLDCVKKVFTCTGDHMIMADVWAEDSTHLHSIISDEIGGLNGVTDICPAIVMEEIE